MKCRECKTKNTDLICKKCGSDNLEFETVRETWHGLILIPLLIVFCVSIQCGTMLGLFFAGSIGEIGWLRQILFSLLLIGTFYGGEYLGKHNK